MKPVTIALAGNPNSGKTTIFNNLTGARQKVGNWPGVTVEKKEGRLRRGEYDLTLIDLPGTYSLTPFSIEEIAARDYILEEKPDVVVNIIDAANLERSLYLAMQIMELNRPVVFALNMADLARTKGIVIDTDTLSRLLGVPVVFTVGNRNQGMDELVAAAVHAATDPMPLEQGRRVKYNREIETMLTDLEALLEGAMPPDHPYPHRWTAIKLLESDAMVTAHLKSMAPDRSGSVLETAETHRQRLTALFHDDPEIILTDERYGFIAGIVKEVVTLTARKRADLSRTIDLVLTNRFLGFPIFIFFIWAMFQITFSLGAYPMAWIETGVSHLSALIGQWMGPGLFRDLMLDGILAGIGSVAVFLPNILILFFCIALFEDTGYMARTAFLMDRVMHMVGLHGKSFIPMLMGFGCNVPAIMATRSLEDQKDRILTILITPFMSCSARLPVYIILAGTFFGARAGTVIFSLYFTGILIAIVSGRIFRSLLLQGEDAPFVMELPPYRVPMARSLVIHMWDRSKMFLKKMGGVILVGSIIIWALSTFPRADVIRSAPVSADASPASARVVQDAGDTGHGNTAAAGSLQRPSAEKEAPEASLVENAYIGRFGKFLAPVFAPLGIDWRSGVALVTGLVAKEVVISTMGVLYGIDGEKTDALGQALKRSGMTPLSALSMMVFVLLYVPCLATIMTIWRETSPGWACFNLIYTTSIAWIGAFLVYQGGTLLGFV